MLICRYLKAFSISKIEHYDLLHAIHNCGSEFWTKNKQKRKTTQNPVRSTVWFSFCQICLRSFIHSTHFHWAFVPRTILGFVVQFLSRVQLFATTWTAARQASLPLTISRSLPKFMSTESVIPSSHLIVCCPLFLLPSIFPSISVFFQWVSSSHQVAQVLELQHQFFQWVFRVDFP